MKKYLCSVLAAIMIFNIFPLNGFAAENTSSEYDKVIALACEVFPEYAATILSRLDHSNTNSRSSSSYEIIYQETRSISNTDSLTLSQLASGDVIVLQNHNEQQSILSIPSSSTTDITTVGVAGTATFNIATTIYPYDVFTLKNVSYTIYFYGDSYFTNYGSVSNSSFYSYTLEEQTGHNIRYTLRVSPTPTHFHSFELYFSNNQLIAEYD